MKNAPLSVVVQDTLFHPILLVDDEEAWLHGFGLTLRAAGIANLILCSDSRQVMEIVGRQTLALIVLDLTMPHLSGEELLATLTEEHPEIPVIILTGLDLVDTAVRCMKLGAFDYFTKVSEEARLVAGVKRAMEFGCLRRENDLLKERFLADRLDSPEVFSEIITHNKAMRSVFQYMEAIAGSPEPVLISGETGVGKELVARALHRLSGRKGGFVPVNVAGLDDTMFADSLFGHKKGAFTGADQSRRGLIDQAKGGTLFLDEIGDLSAASQIKLLRLLQEREYLPLGSDLPQRAECRMVFASHHDLGRMQAAGSFRKDLYYRLQAHRVSLPPLRQRFDDLPLLVEHFLAEAAEQLGRKKPGFPRELIDLLGTYDFPGNLRELRNMVFGALLAAAPLAPTRALSAVEPAASVQGASSYAGPVQGVSKKAKTISVQVGDKIEMLRFDESTRGMEHAHKGGAAIIHFEIRGTEKFATLVEPKLAKLPEGVSEIKTEEMTGLIALGPEKGNYLLVDSRPAPRYHEAHIPSAISIPVPLFKEKPASLPESAKAKGTMLIFYCGGPTCGMSPESAALAQKAGFKNVRAMLEGIPGWKKKGMLTTASEQHVKTGNIILIDLRPESEYRAGHLPRAHNIPLDQLDKHEEAIPSIDKAPVVVYGNSEAETEKALKTLKKWGNKLGAAWPGGVAAWSARGNSLEMGVTPAQITWKRKLGPGEITVADFMKAVDGNGGLIVDVRTKDEVKAGMLKGAVHIPLDEIEAKMASLPKDREILLHCSTGARAEMASQALSKAGYKNRFLMAEVECEAGSCKVLD